MRLLNTAYTRNENLTTEQENLMEEIIESQLLLVWKRLISDHITVTNIFAMFSELPEIEQDFCLIGGGIIDIPWGMKVPLDYNYHCKILEAIRDSKVSLLLFTDEEL